MEINEQIVRVRIGNWWSPDRYYVRVWIDAENSHIRKDYLITLLKVVCRPSWTSPKRIAEFLINNKIDVSAVEIVDKDGFGELHYPEWP
jgi:hypothetical protein